MGNALRRLLQETELVDVHLLVEGVRAVKSEEELRLIKKACEISEEGMKTAIESIKPGVTELDVAAEAEYRMVKLGSDRMNFNTHVASG